MYLRAFGESKDNSTPEHPPSHVFVVPVVVHDAPETPYPPAKPESGWSMTLLELDALLNLRRNGRPRRRPHIP